VRLGPGVYVCDGSFLKGVRCTGGGNSAAGRMSDIQ